MLKTGSAVVISLLIAGTSARCAPVSKTFKLEYGYAVYGYSRNQRFARASGIYYDTKRGELYVADTGNSQIAIFDNKGMPIARFQHFVDSDSGDGRERKPGEPKSLAVLKNGDILVTDNLCNYVDILDFRGRSVQRLWPADLLGLPKSKVRPGCIALDAAENIYLGVSGDVNAILVLTPGLKLKAEVGRANVTDAAAKAITGLWVDKKGKIYATYAQGDCVKVYAPDGRLLTAFGAHESGWNNFSLPSGAVTDAKENIWVVDNLRHVTTVFKQEPDGSGIKTSVIHAIGSFGNKPGQMAFPTAIAGDGETRIFVLEGTGARLQAFNIVFIEDNETQK